MKPKNPKCKCGGVLEIEPNADNPDFRICDKCRTPHYKGKKIMSDYF
jgi:hypothetical protein